MEKNHPTFSHGKICYIEIPAVDLEESASFYHEILMREDSSTWIF
jgi:hypothetical protein